VRGEADLLDGAFLARLEKLALRSRTRVGGRGAGGHRSRRRGQSLEFADHREYVPGDDIRHLDWHLLGRLDRLFIKLFEAREDRTVQILVDGSTSMAGAKWAAARKAAAAVAYASLCGLDRVQIFAATDGLQAAGRAVRGRSAIHRLFGFLRTTVPEGLTDLERAAAALPPARGGAMTVLITDGWDPAGLQGAVRRLRHRGGEAHILHVVDGREIAAEGLSGDLTLVDAETGVEVAVTLDRESRARYADAVEEWLDAAAEAARRGGVGYFRLDAADTTDGGVEERLLRWLRDAERAVPG
jgi:uncharacterized protein (DUF58 family)